jgi:hypothetical protein
VRRPIHIAVAVLTLALALPSAALAQSAGDEQYQDPFEDRGGGQTEQQGSGQQQQQAQAPTTQGQAVDPAASTAQTQPAQTGTLPRTGGATPLLFAYGAVLLLAGTALRRAARRTA